MSASINYPLFQRYFPLLEKYELSESLSTDFKVRAIAHPLFVSLCSTSHIENLVFSYLFETPDPKEEECRFYKILCVAMDALSFMQEAHFISPNFMNRHNLGVLPDQTKVAMARENLIHQVIQVGAEFNTLIRENNFELSFLHANKIKKSWLGNCHEISQFFFFYLLERLEADVKLDIMSLINGDHAFLLINRRWDSQAHLPSSYGERALIFDPWRPNIFLASKHPHHLKGYEPSFIPGVPKLLDFHPDLHSLQLETTNIFSKKEFQDLVSKIICDRPSEERHLRYLKVYLTYFHNSQGQEEKISFAQSIINLPLPHSLANNETISSLHSQMHYYLQVRQDDYRFYPVLSLPEPLSSPLSFPMDFSDAYESPLSFEFNEDFFDPFPPIDPYFLIES